MASHTPGPWKVFETRHPHKFGGEHVERRIGTVAEHPQLKGPSPVVTLSLGVGEEGGRAVTFVGIFEPDAHLIAAAPELLAALKRLRDKAKPCVGYGTGYPSLGYAIQEADRVIAKAEGRES